MSLIENGIWEPVAKLWQMQTHRIDRHVYHTYGKDWSKCEEMNQRLCENFFIQTFIMNVLPTNGSLMQLTCGSILRPNDLQRNFYIIFFSDLNYVFSSLKPFLRVSIFNYSSLGTLVIYYLMFITFRILFSLTRLFIYFRVCVIRFSSHF